MAGEPVEEKMEPLTLVTEIKLQTWVQFKAGILSKKQVMRVLDVLRNLGPDDTINASLDELEDLK